MKTLKRLLFITLIVPSFLLFTSCEKKAVNNDGTGLAEFSISIPGSQAAKSVADTSKISFQIMISVTDPGGNPVFTDKLVPLYVFGTGFVSENVEIKAGEYKLTKFLVINAAGAVVYAAPVAGSPLAYLTNRPLPFGFSIAPQTVTRILPEVLIVGDNPPSQFGYANFGVQIIKPLEFWTMCVLDPGPLMPPIVITTAKLTVNAPDGWHYTFKLEAAANHLVIRGGYEYYTFLLEKEGYAPQKLQFNAKELLGTTKENPLVLRIMWSSQEKVLVLQPGPVKGIDAMITNLNPEKNFGDYKYFETTYLSESMLTVMRSNRSLIRFNLDTLPKSAVIRKVVLTLKYDIPVPFDNSYLVGMGPAWFGGVLQQVVEPWDEFKVTWNTQPKTIESNQVYISPFIKNSNSIEVDVTKLFVSPSATDQAICPNYGMLFRLWPVDKFPGFRFASSDYPDAGMRPRLAIFYSLP